MNKYMLNKILGLDEDAFFDLAIIVPMKSIYNAAIKVFEPAIINKKCLFENAIYFGEENVNTILICSPQGPAIKDVLYCLHNKVKNFYFVGWCGAVASRLQIGDIVRVRESVRGERRYKKDKRNITFENVKNYTADCFYEENILLPFLEENLCDVVDMETYYLFEVAEKEGMEIEILLVISDLIIDKPFYFITDKEYEKIIKSSLWAIGTILV